MQRLIETLSHWLLETKNWYFSSTIYQLSSACKQRAQFPHFNLIRGMMLLMYNDYDETWLPTETKSRKIEY